MSKINWGRVLLGGLVGGVIIFVIDMLVNGLLFGNEWQAAMKALGRTPSTSGLVNLAVFALLAGTGVTLLYAGVRPRFGPGPKTAIITGLWFWVFGYWLPTIGLLSFHLFPPRLPLISACGGLAEALLASLVGAWLYKE